MIFNSRELRGWELNGQKIGVERRWRLGGSLQGGGQMMSTLFNTTRLCRYKSTKSGWWCFSSFSKPCRGGWHLRRKLVFLWRGLREAESHRNSSIRMLMQGWGWGCLFYTDHSLCSTVIVAWARIQVVAGFWWRSFRRGSLLALHS